MAATQDGAYAFLRGCDDLSVEVDLDEHPDSALAHATKVTTILEWWADGVDIEVQGAGPPAALSHDATHWKRSVRDACRDLRDVCSHFSTVDDHSFQEAAWRLSRLVNHGRALQLSIATLRRWSDGPQPPLAELVSSWLKPAWLRPRGRALSRQEFHDALDLAVFFNGGVGIPFFAGKAWERIVRGGPRAIALDLRRLVERSMAAYGTADQLGARDLDGLEVDHRARERGSRRADWQRWIRESSEWSEGSEDAIDAIRDPRAEPADDTAELLELFAVLQKIASDDRERLMVRLIADGATATEACKFAGLSRSAFRAFQGRARRHR